MIMLSLSFKQEYLGHVAMEIGPRDATVFESLGELLSTALKASQLSEALIEEATARERAEKSRLTQELDIASRIQTAILPKNCQVRGLEIGARMLPATEVGGDYYDVLPVEDGCWLGIGDVAGHGLPTGLVMMMIQSIVATSTRTQPDEPPSSTWNALNSVLYENVRERLEQDEHATFCLLRYRDSGGLVCAGAHEPVIVYRAASGCCELIDVAGSWVAVMPEPDTSGDQVIQLEPGDIMLLYTDGITEALNASGEPFGTDRLCEVLERHSSEPTTSICDHVLAAVRGFMVQQDDDMTLLVSRYHGAPKSPAPA
jgi:serine phosphatase RsbU (regulator of sigma subunit)